MNRSTASLLLFPALILAACETTESTKPRYLSSTRYLKEEAGGVGNKALVRQSDPASLKKYNRVVIEDVRVIHSKKSATPTTKASREEAERLAERFEEILRDELRPHYQITNRRGRNTLVVKATLTDLEPSKPGVFVFNYLPYAAAVTTGVSLATGKTPGAGSTTVEAEVVDAYSRRQVYAIVDQFKGSKFQPAGIERWGQTEAAMRAWSRKIRMGIQGSAPANTAPAATKRSTAKSGETGRPNLLQRSKQKKG